MPRFAYKALTVDGQDVSGELDASDRAAALRELLARGTSVTEIAERRQRMPGLLTGRPQSARLRIRSKQVAILTRQLAVSLEAGLPLMTALDVMGRELDHAHSRQLLHELGEKVQQGASLSDAMGNYPAVFSTMYVRLVRVGETGGVLDQILAQLADMLERQNELRDRVKTASIYPAILLLVGMVSAFIIVYSIVPRIIGAIEADAFLLPWPTRVLMGMSDFLRDYWWLLIGIAIVAVVSWRQVVLRGPGRPWWDSSKLRVPILGRLIRQLEAARFARSLGVLARGGVSITESMPVVCDTVVNIVMRNAVYQLAESIKSGDSIASPLQRCGLFPPLLVQMVHVGESTGKLDEMLLRAANVHESEARVTLDRVVSVLPVLMILVLACLIGFIVAGLVLAVVEFQTTGFGSMAGT